MINFIILMTVTRTKVNEVAEQIADLPAISEVYSVSGQYDLVAIARVKSNDDLADLVTHHLAQVEDIEHTETMLALRAFSRHALEAMFSMP